MVFIFIFKLNIFNKIIKYIIFIIYIKNRGEKQIRSKIYLINHNQYNLDKIYIFFLIYQV